MQKTMCLLVVFLLTAGCLGESGTEQLDSEETMVPEFTAYDQDNIEHNLSGKIGAPWILYVSTSWCTHCETTLDAYDQVIPNGSLFAFNKDSREQYSNMSEWKSQSEENIGRNLSIDFIHAPSLAEALNVTGIPRVFFVDSSGIIQNETIGVQDDLELLSDMWNDLVGEEIE